MKKLFIFLSLLLAANCIFAESKFMGIPMGISKKNAELNRIYEINIEKAFSDFCYDVKVNFIYTENEQAENQQVCGFKIAFFGRNGGCDYFGKIFASYFEENNYKKCGAGEYYNNDFIIILGVNVIVVMERSRFKNAMKELME